MRQSGDLIIRPFEPTRDRREVERLWSASLPASWPILPQGLDMLNGGWLAEHDGRAIGLAARSGPALQLLVVSPRWRRKGIGSELFNVAQEDARSEGFDVLLLGSGGEAYIWPGIPADAEEAIAFFERLGYRWAYTAIDLVLDLRRWKPKDSTIAAARQAPVVVAPARLGAELSEVIAFERQRFPRWVRHFERGEGVLVARRGASVLGALLYSPSASIYEPAVASPCGSIGCVGVDPTEQRQGIATAMVLAATQIVRAERAVCCHIGWAWRTGLYERVGYRPWRTYLMSTVNA